MFVSLHGNRVGFNQTHLLFDGRPVGSFPSNGGNVFFVNSAIDATDGRSPATAFGTLDEAFAKCTANNGDVIYVMANHAETVTGAGGITHDVAGVSVIGIGHGNQRPRFLMDAATTVTYVISAADAYVSNLVFAGGHSDIVTCFNITAQGAWLDKLEFVQNTTDENFLTAIKATSTTDGNASLLKVTGCKAFNIDVSTVEFLEINATLDGLVFTDNFTRSAGTACPAILVATGKLLTNAEIARNTVLHLATSGELFISNDGTTNTGAIYDNRVGHADVTGAHDGGWDGGGFRLFNNLSTSVDNLQGVVAPAADANL